MMSSMMAEPGISDREQWEATPKRNKGRNSEEGTPNLKAERNTTGEGGGRGQVSAWRH